MVARRHYLLLLVGVAPLLLGAQGHDDPISRVLLALVVVLPSAKLGGWLAETLGQPAVMGELLAGMVIG
ncbi:MAG TPA: hypothetical protein VGL70_22655, partial [Candidatus Binatia bacterium]